MNRGETLELIKAVLLSINDAQRRILETMIERNPDIYSEVMMEKQFINIEDSCIKCIIDGILAGEKNDSIN